MRTEIFSEKMNLIAERDDSVTTGRRLGQAFPGLKRRGNCITRFHHAALADIGA
jgi:hypothetical protein